MNYEAEVCERWGNTEAYREYEKKNYSKEKYAEINDGLMSVFAEFAECKSSGKAADSEEAKKLVLKLQAYITENYYACTNEILAGLGQMYVCDERFKKNINKHGDGAAEFASEAISIYCSKEGT